MNKTGNIEVRMEVRYYMNMEVYVTSADHSVRFYNLIVVYQCTVLKVRVIELCQMSNRSSENCFTLKIHSKLFYIKILCKSNKLNTIPQKVTLDP